MASRANIYIDQGTDFRTTIEMFDADDDELVISTYDFFASMKKIYSSTNLLNFTIEKSGNDITLVLTDEQTASCKPGKYQYDVIMRKPTGELTKVVEGLAFVVDTITGV